MSTTTIHPTTTAPPPFEVPGPVTHVPSLEELEQLTAVPDQRVVFRGVDWAFYDRLVDSIPERSNIHVDYDGRDLELMSKGWKHEDIRGALDQFVKVIAEELAIPCRGLGETTWKRPQLMRGIESDLCYYFQPEKLAMYAQVRGLKDISLCPNPDMAIEVDISRPAVDRQGIYAALRIAEVWRFDGERFVIERLTPNGQYIAVETSLFLPIRAEEIQRWIVEEDLTDASAWARRLRTEIKTRAANQS
jgi:Uma2 family endonuclease